MNKLKQLDERKSLIDRAMAVAKFFAQREVKFYNSYFKGVYPDIDESKVTAIMNLRVEPACEDVLQLMENEMNRLQAA